MLSSHNPLLRRRRPKKGGSKPVQSATYVASVNSNIQQRGGFQVLAKQGAGVHQPAEALHSPKPKYPSIAVRKLLEAQVRVSFVVNGSGEVEDIKFADKTNKYFARSIKRTLKKWRFEPAKMNGMEVESVVTRTFSFTEPEKRLLYITGTRFPKVLKDRYLPKDNRA